MGMQSAEREFFTSDVYLASCLMALGYPVLDLDWGDPRRCQFIFQNTEALQEAVNAFWNKRLAVEPQALFGSLRSLKWRLHNG